MTRLDWQLLGAVVGCATVAAVLFTASARLRRWVRVVWEGRRIRPGEASDALLAVRGFTATTWLHWARQRVRSGG